MTVEVSWHEAADFALLVQRASPGAVEVLASREPPLYSSEDHYLLLLL